jgi:CubicO group peptidase (beta-lactamase class C family)
MSRRVVPAALRVGVLAVAVVMALGFRSGPAGRPTGASIGAAMDTVWMKYSSQLLGLCVGAVDDRVHISKCYGKKAPNLNAKPGAHTLFRIESVSKTFAATLLALRVDQHKVALADPVRNDVPALGGQPLYPTSLTLLDLADHYSGLPKQSPDAGNVDAFLLKTGSCLSRASCRRDVPGHGYAYSNWAVSVLGQVLALHDGFSDGQVGPWEKDNEQAVTQPLGMNDTRSLQKWLTSDPAQFTLQRAISGQENPSPSPYGNPGGGLYSSPHDMLLWLRYSMGLHGTPGLLAAHHLLYEDTANQRPVDSAGRMIGLVWNVFPGTGATCVSKDGDGQGFHASVIFVKGQKRGVFLLVNDNPTTSYRTMASELLNSLPATPGAGSPKCPPAQG